jgi:hypothetical protein
MVFESEYTPSEDSTNQLTWDLRTFYVKYVSSYILSFKMAEDVNNYPLMLRYLDKWHSTIKHEWIKEVGVVDETYEKLRKEFVMVAQKYKEEFHKKGNGSLGLQLLDDKLQDMKHYLLFMMKKSKMFGSDSVNRGL